MSSAVKRPSPNNRVLIVGVFKFPFGSAAASRVRNIACGLTEQGLAVDVLTVARIAYREHDNNGLNEFWWHGIRYESLNEHERRNDCSSVVIRYCRYLIAACRLWFKVIRLVKDGSVHSILLYSRSAILSFPVALIARIYKVALYYDIVEWFPISYYRCHTLNVRYYDDLLSRHLPRIWCKGVIVISRFIESQYIGRGVRCLLMPGLFNVSTWNIAYSAECKVSDNDYIVMYAGSCKPGDGFDALLMAVRSVAADGYPVRLDVVGTDGMSGHSSYYKQICDSDIILRDRVRFHGRVPEDEYPLRLMSADCLALPRSNSQIARASFPTRLPEYLATGVPVLTTDVPDINEYLEKGVHAEIVTECSATALANGIMRLHDDRPRAVRIGQSGRTRSCWAFDYRVHAERLWKYMNE